MMDELFFLDNCNKISELSVLIADMAKYCTTPVATYTHTTNTEIVVSAVDVEANTFTSVGHGLSNGNIIYPIVNIDAGNIYPYDKYPTGLTAVPNYVVGKTDDTFQLSLTSGGAAIDLSANANMDLTKWHFEKFSAEPTFINLPACAKYKVKIKGRTLRLNSATVILPNALTYAAEWLKTGSGTAYAEGYSSLTGDIAIDGEVTFDYSGTLKMDTRGITSKSTSASATTTTLVNQIAVSPKYRAGLITSISISSSYIANGTVLEVFKLC